MEYSIRKDGNDGWDSFEQSTVQNEHFINVNKHLQGRNILQEQYSLEPDMISGWMPKLPSCPIPLTYKNPYTDQVLEKLVTQNQYDIVYRAKRLINSVQVHQSYDYKWKYRQRYQIKVNSISEAIENVGILQQSNVIVHSIDQKVKQCPIIFDSNFQSGNLDFATRIKQNEYDCFLRSDTNTKGHTNWYYFKVNNRSYTGNIKFNICNIVKDKNLYGKGMTPYTLVKSKYKQNQKQWLQNQCFQVQFNERLCKYGTQKIYNQLEFTFDFHTENMQVSFAYSIPYTFSDLQKFISEIKSNCCVRVQNLCESFSGLQIPLIILSNNEKKKKSNVIITARIHPGQTNSSHMLQGFLQEILKQKSSLSTLNQCNFYIVPMMNPDGVVVGNYRTSFSGRDLNRKFNQLQNFLFPQISGLARLIKKLKKKRQNIQFFFDFHSHSAKKDLFCYGPDHLKGVYNYFRARLLTKMLQKQHSMFSPSKCIYSISQFKKTTCRAYMLYKENIPMTFTFEVSNGLYHINKHVETTYNLQSLHIAGSIICKGLLNYLNVQSYERFSKLTEKVPRYARNSDQLGKFSYSLKTQIAKRAQSKSPVNNVTMVSNQQYKDLLNEIIQVKQQIEKIQQNKSDSQSSQEDIIDEQLNQIFHQRQKYMNPFSYQKKNRKEINLNRKSNKVSLRNISNQTIKKNPSFQMAHKSRVIIKKISPLPQKTIFLNKYAKQRILYQETHPPAPKKIYQNIFLTKKVIKQKRFPIIF